jgi:hypothetical protein
VSNFIHYYAECRYAECCYAECRYAEYRYAECHYVECHYADCHYDKCHYAQCNSTIILTVVIMCAILLNVALLTAVKLIINMLSVVAPFRQEQILEKLYFSVLLENFLKISQTRNRTRELFLYFNLFSLSFLLP